MRMLGWLLVLANVGALAYFNKDALTVSAMSVSKPDLNADQLKILTAQEVESMPKRGALAPTVDLPTVAEVQELAPESTQTPATVTAGASPGVTPAVTPSVNKSPLDQTLAQVAAAAAAPATPPPEKKPEPKPEPKIESKQCYEWASFDLGSVAEAASRANRLDIKTVVNQQNAGEAVRYWVYKPPLASAELAQQKAEELRAMGISDFFVVQEPKWRNAISFGVFKDEQLAINLMNTLKNKGVREVVKAVRNNKGEGNAAIRLVKVSPQQYSQMRKVLADYPDTELKEVRCN